MNLRCVVNFQLIKYILDPLRSKETIGFYNHVYSFFFCLQPIFRIVNNIQNYIQFL